VPSAPTSATPAALPSNALPTWRGELAERLQDAKRYPEAARAHDEQGVATATFTMDRSGHVLSVNLVHSSGSQALDEEAVALIRRADPMPPMPAALPGTTITLTIPVRFSLR
jgi:protein TonB